MPSVALRASQVVAFLKSHHFGYPKYCKKPAWYESWSIQEADGDNQVTFRWHSIVKQNTENLSNAVFYF